MGAIRPDQVLDPGAPIELPPEPSQIRILALGTSAGPVVLFADEAAGTIHSFTLSPERARRVAAQLESAAGQAESGLIVIEGGAGKA